MAISVASGALPDADKQKFRERAAFEGRTGYHLFIAEFLQKQG